MADNKSYITEARELIGSISFLLPDTDAWRNRVEAIIATEFTRIASEATRVERERCAEVAGQQRGRGDLRDADAVRYYNGGRRQAAIDILAVSSSKDTP